MSPPLGPRLGTRLNPTQRHHNPGLDPSLTLTLTKTWIQPCKHNLQGHQESLSSYCRVSVSAGSTGLQSREPSCPVPGRLYLQLMELRACSPSAAGWPNTIHHPLYQAYDAVSLWTWICIALEPLGYKIANPPLGLFNTHPIHPPTASPLLYSSGNGAGPTAERA